LQLKDYPRKAYSINQFTQPPCYELDGEDFIFVMDSGYDYELHITGRESCEWRMVDEALKRETYRCLKSDDTTYLLHYEIKDAGLRTAHTWVIDLAQRLVTLLTCKVGLNPKHPFLISSHFDFGAIRSEAVELPFKRHAFTSDMVGTCVEWHWKPAFLTRHSYYSTSFYRITHPKEMDTTSEFGSSNAHLMPSSDEWARYVKIKEQMYLFVLTESNSERIVGDRGRFRSNNMAFLQNYDRMYHVGRSFGTAMEDGKPFPVNMLFGAFGNPVELDPAFLDAPNPFVI